MLLEDVKIGMHLRDPKGNVYEVLAIKDVPRCIVHLKCITFVRPVKVESHFGFTREGQTWWVHADREQLIAAENPVVRQIARSLGELKNDTITVDGFSVTCNGTTKYFRIVTSKCRTGCEITIADMKLKEQHLTRDNIRVGMTVRIASGMAFSVRGYSDDGVLIQGTLQSPDLVGTMKQISVDTLVEWADSDRPIHAGLLTTKDFIIME